MADVPILYSDGFELTLSPFGALLRFGARLPVPTQGGPPGQAFVEQVRLGMSLQHLKVMTTILVREILRQETASGIKTDVAEPMLQELKISPADFASFWGLPPKNQIPAAITTPSALILAPS